MIPLLKITKYKQFVIVLQDTKDNLESCKRGVQMTIGERIKELRKDKGYSVRYLSDTSGISRSTISRWENNHLNPSEENLKKLIVALEITASKFWREPLSYVKTEADDNKGIKEQINRIVNDLDDIQIAINVLREHYDLNIDIIHKIGTDNTICFKKGIETAARAVSRQTIEKDRGFTPLTRKEFRYQWCDFVQYPKREKSHKYD